MKETSMPDHPPPDDIQELVERPRETLNVEIKSHLDLFADREHQASFARHVCALANHGGGYIVFGFADKDLSTVPSVDDIRLKYHRDVISKVVSKYLSPPLLCDVVFVEATTGAVHPVVRVPAHGASPVCTTRDGPHDKGQPRGIRAATHYIRKLGTNGPESVAISKNDEWEKVIRRCVLVDRQGLLSQIDTLISPRPISTQDDLRIFHDAAKKRYSEVLVEMRPTWVTPLATNHYQLSYSINCDSEEATNPSNVKSILQLANAKTRELVWTGWSMFYVFETDELKPHFRVLQTESGEDLDVLETNLVGRTSHDTTLPDFWWYSLDGKMTLIRAYREDRDPIGNNNLNLGQYFRPFLLVRELSEFLRHARSMSENFPSASTVSVRCEWLGLQGRTIAEPGADISIARTAEQNRRGYTGEWPIVDLTNRWEAIVAEIATSVLRLFDPDLYLTDEWVRQKSPKFRSL